MALSFTGAQHVGFVLASLGGSSAFLFGLTRAPAAQPRALIGGHIGTAAIGIACAQAFGGGIWVHAVAVSLSLAYMLVTRTVHPPAGANPIIMVHAHAPWTALLDPVLLGVGCLGAVAMIWSRLYPGLVHYPVSPWEPSPPSITWGGWDALPPR